MRNLNLGCFDQSLDGWINTDITPHIFVAKVPGAARLIRSLGRMTAERYEQHQRGDLNFVLRSVYAAALAHAGREEKARVQVATLVEMAPTISPDGVRRFMEYMSIDPGFVSRVLAGLRTGGLV